MNRIDLIRLAKELTDMGLIDEADDILEEIPNTDEETIKKPEISENYETLMDKFIGAILYDLSEHNNIGFDSNGQLNAETIRSIVNSFEENLSHPL